MAASNALIPKKVYQQIVSKIPVLCVDLLIWNDRKLLLVKRKNHPLKGHWWIPGGRVLLGEEPIQAVRRKAKEEVGLSLSSLNFIGYYSDIYKRNAFQVGENQTVSLVFICSVKDPVVSLDSQSSSFKWADGMPERLSNKLRYS